MNEFPLESYYTDCPPDDVYVDSTHLLGVQINHAQWEPGSGVIADMLLNVPCTSTFVIARFPKYTNSILTGLHDTYFPTTYDWKRMLGKANHRFPMASF